MADERKGRTVSIQRYVFPLCALDDVGSHDVVVTCKASSFRADTIRTNVTTPGQAFIEQIIMARSPQLMGEIDAYEFSVAAEQAMRDEWFRERGITEAEWLAQVEARAAVDEDKMRREEAGEEVDWGENDEAEEDGPPCAPRLFLVTVTRGDEIRVKTRYSAKVPEGKFGVVLLGFGVVEDGLRNDVA
jgi:hypothetical protein